MSSLSPRERLLKTLKKEKTDRPPVICTGGMMNAAIQDIMNKTGNTLPEGHKDYNKMTAVAADVHEFTGFENIGVPFCMTAEAEVLGSGIDFGTLECEPKISYEKYSSSSSVEYKDIKRMLKEGRIETIIQSGWQLSKKYGDIPIIGNLTGPISTGASIVDPVTFLKELRKDPQSSHRVLDYVSELLIAYAREMADNGISAISIGDPTATGEILGPKMFNEYAVRYLNKVIEAVQSFGIPVIVHICGQLSTVRHLVPEIRSNAISTDAMVNLRKLKDDYPQLTVMGNVSTYMLEDGEEDRVYKYAESLVRSGIDIISPACGLSTSSKLGNISAMTTAVKDGKHA